MPKESKNKLSYPLRRHELPLEKIPQELEFDSPESTPVLKPIFDPFDDSLDHEIPYSDFSSEKYPQLKNISESLNDLAKQKKKSPGFNKEEITLIYSIYKSAKELKAIILMSEQAQFKTLPQPHEKGKPSTYEKWAERHNKYENPLQFLNRVWGNYIQNGLLYQTDLRGERRGTNAKRGLDKTLFDAISKYCRDNNLNIGDIIPTKSDQVVDRVCQLKCPFTH